MGILNFSQVIERVIRYLLEKYLGKYISGFTFDEVVFQLTSGKCSIENVHCDVKALNDKSEEYNLPFEFLEGTIEYVSIVVPWTRLLQENTIVEVKGLRLVVQPKERPQDVSMFDTMWSNMASSRQLAEECINSNDNDDKLMGDIPNRSEGVENIASIIDTVFANMQVKFSEVSLKIEQVLPNKETGISLEIKIAKSHYCDEAGVNSGRCAEGESDHQQRAFTFYRVVFEGVSLYTCEFLLQDRVNTHHSLFHQVFSNMEKGVFVPGSPEMPPTHPSLPKRMEPNCNREPVLISRLNGQQELRLKLKQNGAVVGPKVDVEFNFGIFNLFLMPQQVHLLFSLINGILKHPDSACDASPQRAPLSVASKPMRPADYALVEQELLRQQERGGEVTSRSLKNQGWSSHSLDESDEDFHLMTMENKSAGDIFLSTQEELLTSSMNSDTKSEASSFTSNPRARSRGSSTVQAILTNPLSELTHFHGCLSSLLVIVLHDDSVQETTSGQSDKVASETFFDDLLDLQLKGFDFKDFAQAREPLSRLCETNHLRLMASGIIFDGNETASSAERILKFNLSFHQFEILECLFNSTSLSSEAQNPKYMQLITFPKKTDCVSESKEACLKLKYSRVECLSQMQRARPPANKLDIQLGPVMCDVDISLTDRIRTLLSYNTHPEQHPDAKWEHWKESKIGLVSSQTSSKTDVTLSSSHVTINLRFPIPDLRSAHDMDRAPWWQQNIHREVLILELREASFKTTLDQEELVAKYDVQCQDVHGLFKIPSSEEPISFLRVSVDPDSDEVSRNDGFDWPRLEIRHVTRVVSQDLESGLEEEEAEQPYSCSLSYALMTQLAASEPSPFTSTSVIHEKEGNSSNLTSDHDEIVKPSDKETMQRFVEQTLNRSRLVFDFTLPTLNIVLPDRDFFELLYNRLSSDLCLWTNASPTSTTTYEGSGFKVHIPGLDMGFSKGPDQLYPIFRSFTNDSNSDSDEEETLYMSVHEYHQRQRQRHQQRSTANGSSCLTEYSVLLAIAKGSLRVNAPLAVSDEDSNCEAAMPEACGQLQLRVEDASLFIATHYKGDPNEAFLCMHAERSALYHNGMKNVKSQQHSIVEPLSSGYTPEDLKCIIYASDPTMHLKSAVHLDSPSWEMLKFSVHIVRNPKQQIKTFKIAIEIAGATLRHYVVPGDQVWVNQLISFLKVRDFPVSGYVPPAVVTELHLNLSNCAVDYRPFKLPYRTALTVENFNMSCNVTASTPSFLFRIISEELRLFISNNVDAKKVDLRKHYVCVFDSGLIDISIRTSIDEKDNPKLEMSISNNKVHIRTCADSFKALLELINYLSSNGDMEQDSTDSPKESENEKSFTNNKMVDPESENLDALMAEAMKECCRVLNGDEQPAKTNADFEYSNTDDEFCILEDDPGLGLIPRNGEPQVRMLTNEPIRIIENHFSVPPGKSDVLRAPRHFPRPLFLLTLQEMALVWHLYGGTDFGRKKKKHKKKSGMDSKSDSLSKHSNRSGSVRFCDQDALEGVAASFCKVTPVMHQKGGGLEGATVHFSMEHVTIGETDRSNFTPDSWLHRGGPGRNHDVLMELQLNKVQFQREIYPLDSEYASRYILLINDVEVRDRLAASQINKFLYQFATKDLPRQSHANMFDVKAVYTRPDPKSAAEECSLRISCKPLRLNVDQDSLMFLVDFFQEVLGIPVSEGSEGESEVLKEAVLPPQPHFVTHSNGHPNTSPTNETFYRYFSFSPDVLIRIDYHGKRVQMEQGALKGLILGLGQLNASEIKLKRLCYRHGLLGHHKLATYALTEWQQDILKNQLPSLLGGVGPMHSFVQLFRGVRDLFYLPVAQYQRDGQIVRGLQRGASSFSTSTVVAALDLSSRFFCALQGTAEFGFDMVSPGPRLSGKFQSRTELYRKSSQPADIIEGMAAAYNVMKEGLEDTARTIYRVASTEHEHKGVPGALGGVLRQIPPSLFRPIILSSEATSYVLDGARHQLMPDAHQEDVHKWKTKAAN